MPANRTNIVEALRARIASMTPDQRGNLASTTLALSSNAVCSHDAAVLRSVAAYALSVQAVHDDTLRGTACLIDAQPMSSASFSRS